MMAGRLNWTPQRRSRSGAAPVGIIIFLLVVVAVAIGINFYAKNKARVVRDGIEAQIVAEEVVSSYMLPATEREAFLKEKGIQAHVAGEDDRRKALARSRKSEDARDTGRLISFPPYESFRSKHVRGGTYDIDSHVILTDPVQSEGGRVIHYQCRAARLGTAEVWEVGNLRFSGVPIDGLWTVGCSGVKLKQVEQNWMVEGGMLTLKIADGSRPLRHVNLGPGGGG